MTNCREENASVSRVSTRNRKTYPEEGGGKEGGKVEEGSEAFLRRDHCGLDGIMLLGVLHVETGKMEERD